MSTLSFTGERRVRFPAPDVARGFMLALIALANVPFWVRFFPDYPAPGQAALDAMSVRRPPRLSAVFDSLWFWDGDHGQAHDRA